MKNLFINVFSVFFFSILSLNLSAQYGPQFDNPGFEQWTTRETESVSEPVHWHSGGTATGTWSSMMPNSAEQSSQTRPGSSGSKSVRLVPSSVFGITANGTVTNGRINAGSTSPSGSSNYNYTQRSQNVYNTPITQLPDSLSVWVCFRSQSTSHKAQVKAVVHGNADYQIIADGTENPSNMHVATADQRFTRTAANGGAYNWTRLSIPFINNGPCTDVHYILLMATTNETPGTGSTNDDLFLDDVLLIYSPTLSMGQLASSSLAPNEAITIPFTLTGTMSPDNLNASANQVIAELSDANGSFSNPTVLGTVVTNTSGSIAATVPNVADGQYQIRVRSTNYPMIGQNIQTVSITSPTQSFTVTVAANPNDGGNVTGGGTYNQGTSCTVTATANTGYSFTNWTENGNVVSTDANYTFTVEGDRNLVANFQTQTYSITASADPSAGGNVSGGGTFNYGQNCTLTASANQGYTFINWTKNGTQVSTNASYTFTVTESAAYVAHFQIQSYNITASADPSAGGNVSGGGTFNYSQSCTLTASANQGYTFVNWTKNGTQVSTNASYTFTVTESAAYVAHFQIQSYNITASADPSAGGDVSGGGTFNYGQSCTVHATANEGYTFINWTENGAQVSANADYTFTVISNRTLVAHFSTQGYVITAVATPEEGGVVSGSGGYNFGEVCTLTATANVGYTFVNWTKDNTEVSTEPTYSFTVTETATFVAHFSANSYTIRATANPSESGTVSGSGTYTYGEICNLLATANEGFIFVEWTKNGIQVSTEASYSFTVTESEDYEAQFQPTASVDENMSTSQIFPNPFASMVSIKAEKTIKSIRVYDIYGRLVKEQDVAEKCIELDLSDLSEGSYLIQLDFGNRSSAHRIVKH